MSSPDRAWEGGGGWYQRGRRDRQGEHDGHSAQRTAQEASTMSEHRRHTVHSWEERYRYGGERVTICRICGEVRHRTRPEVSDHQPPRRNDS